WKWRKAFGVAGQATTPGSKRAHLAHSIAGAAAMQAKEWSDEECDTKARISKRLGLKPGARWTPETGAWTDEERALLGTDLDEEVGEKLGRTPTAVRSQRALARLPAYRDRRRRTRDD